MFELAQRLGHGGMGDGERLAEAPDVRARHLEEALRVADLIRVSIKPLPRSRRVCLTARLSACTVVIPLARTGSSP